VGVQVGLDDSGVNAVDPHVTVLLVLQHAIQLEGHQDLGSLGASVGRLCNVVRLELQVVKVHSRSGEVSG